MSRRRKKVSLGTFIRETVLIRRYRAAARPERFDWDWESQPYNRIAVVNALLAATHGGDYLEIGCAGDDLFRAVLAPRKVGVDPARGGTHRMTSDHFFGSWEGGPFDVIFIDGLHHYQQVRRDLDNALAHLKPGGFVAIHDMLPRDWLEEHTPQIRTRGWTGDGWKVAIEMAASTDVDFRLIAVDHGVAVIRSRSPAPQIPDMALSLSDARFGYFYDHAKDLPIVDWPTAAAWIGGPAAD